MLYNHTFIICEIYENYNRNHKIIKLLLTLIVEFAVAMLIMGIFIYFGYTKVYETDMELFTVKILGLPIYQLTKMEDSYVGETRTSQLRWFPPAIFQRINPTVAMSSTSHSTFFGKVLTATQERAGFDTKYFA